MKLHFRKLQSIPKKRNPKWKILREQLATLKPGEVLEICGEDNKIFDKEIERARSTAISWSKENNHKVKTTIQENKLYVLLV